MPLPRIQPTLFNSANPWATTEDDLFRLYISPYTGAVTVRTCLLNGFAHDPSIHQHLYFDARSNTAKSERSPNANSTLNTYGYSPVTLDEYLTIIEAIVANSPGPRKAKKPFIVSVTGSSDDVVQCYRHIIRCAAKLPIPLLMEINLSCPNIADKPPPAYSGVMLQEYLFALQLELLAGDSAIKPVLIGIKTPPYTYHDQFASLIDALLASTGGGLTCPVDFITSTNTLGSCLILEEADDVMAPDPEPSSYTPALASASGSGIGGAGGSMIHPLALGNVRTIRSMLDRHEPLRRIEIIGVGGVGDYAGYARMKACGAAVVAVGTAFGKEGVDVFEKIVNENDTLAKFGKLATGNGVKINGIEEQMQRVRI